MTESNHTQDDEPTTVAIHVGIRDAEIEAFVKKVTDVFVPQAFHILRDDWEEWGEHLERDPFHILIYTTNPDPIVDFILTSDTRERLVPMQQEHQVGVVLVVSDAADWSLDVRNITFDQIKEPA